MKNSKIDDKIFFTIGEVANIIETKPYIIRFWEKKIPSIRPQRYKNKRMYTREQITNLLRIKEMLDIEKYNLDGIKKHINKNGNFNNNKEQLSSNHYILQSLREVRSIIVKTLKETC